MSPFYEEVGVGLVAASSGDFAVLDSAKLVVLLPQIGFEDFKRRKKAQDIYVPVRWSVIEVVLSRVGYQCGPMTPGAASPPRRNKRRVGEYDFFCLSMIFS